MRGTLRNVDRAFSGFFNRVRNGKKSGYPRFKGKNQFRTISVDGLDNGHPLCAGGKRIKFTGIGKIKIRLHRPMIGSPKTMRISLKGTRWYISIWCSDVPKRTLPSTGRSVGVDVGISYLAVTSGGKYFENPAPLKKARKHLRQADRRFSSHKIGSKRRDKSRVLLGKKHAHIANVRRQYHIDIANWLVSRYDTIYIEKLNILALGRSMLSREVKDASWGKLFQWISRIAENAGREVIAVEPAGTSQRCSGCVADVPKDLSERIHHCPICGLVMNRDENAARNIQRAGRALRREGTGFSPL